MPVSLPVDLLLQYIVVNPPERKLAKQSALHGMIHLYKVQGTRSQIASLRFTHVHKVLFRRDISFVMKKENAFVRVVTFFN